MAWLEAASVVAFETLHRDLLSSHAPRRLRRATRKAAADEARHTRIMARVARVPSPTIRAVARPHKRPLLDTLRENAVEGCVRETFGAAIGEWVARYHTDAVLRRAFVEIAPDEAQHAELAWNVHRWGLRRLRQRDQHVVTSALQDAVHALRCELASATESPVPRTIALALFDALNARAWQVPT